MPAIVRKGDALNDGHSHGRNSEAGNGNTREDGDDIFSQYTAFTRIIREQEKKHGKTRKAVEETIRICQADGILRDYLDTRKQEVINIV